jgi:hypothetical protein
MINGMEAFVGLKLKKSVTDRKQKRSSGNGWYVITRPTFYSDSMHINMYIYFDDDGVITGFSGDKCYSVYRGLYNRSGSVHHRDFSQKDIQFLKKYVRENTEG